MGRKPKQENLCVDCGKYAIKYYDDYFMATDKLWKSHGVGRGVLCLACFNKRLNRKLRKTDFIDAKINRLNPIIKKIMEGKNNA